MSDGMGIIGGGGTVIQYDYYLPKCYRLISAKAVYAIRDKASALLERQPQIAELTHEQRVVAAKALSDVHQMAKTYGETSPTELLKLAVKDLSPAQGMLVLGYYGYVALAHTLEGMQTCLRTYVQVDEKIEDFRRAFKDMP
jgi:hypothetical protein